MSEKTNAELAEDERKKVGRPTIGDKAMSTKQRQRRYQKRKAELEFMVARAREIVAEMRAVPYDEKWQFKISQHIGRLTSTLGLPFEED